MRGQLWIYLAFVPSDEDTEEEAQSEQVPSAPDEVCSQVHLSSSIRFLHMRKQSHRSTVQ